MAADDFLLRDIKAECLSIVSEGVELSRVCGCYRFLPSFYLLIVLLETVFWGQWGKEGPGRVEEYVCRELLDALVLLNVSPMHTDDVPDALTDGQVLEALREEDQCAVLHDSIMVNGLCGVHNPQGADESVGFVRFVRELSIHYDSIKVVELVLSHLAVLQGTILVLSSLLSLL
jgi:hypothetical protein